MFTDRAYVHLDVKNDNFIVELGMKNLDDSLGAKEFENELIIQTARYVINKKTKTLRELMLARAVASTILVNNDLKDDKYDDEEVIDIDGMLED